MSNFEQLTKDLIQTQILQALKDAPQYIDELVRAAMEHEVNEHGTKPDFYSRTKMPWLEWCVRDSIRKSAERAILEVVKEMEPGIKESVKKVLSSDDLVAVFAKRIMNDVTEYKINVTVTPEEKK